MASHGTPSADSKSDAAIGRSAIELLANAPTGIAVIWRDGRIRYVNRVACQLFGQDAEQLIGTNFRLLCIRPDLYRQMAASFAENGAATFPEVELRQPGGHSFWAKMIWQKTPDGGTDGAALWIEDLTARRSADETLAGLFDAAPLPMMLCTIEDATMLRANRRAVELFAGERDGRSINLDEILGEATTRSFLRRLQNGGFIDDFEVMLNTSYGESYCGTVSGQIVRLAGQRYVLVGMNDITDRKQAEQTLQRFFDGAPLAMLLVRVRDLRITRINRRASELFAHGPDSKSVALEELLGEEPSRRFLAQLRGGGFIDTFECVLATGWGENLWANLSGQMIEIDAEQCVLIGVRDTTERKRWEDELHAAKDEAEQATQAKSQFLATMSHEIRTPMNGVLGMIEVLSTTPMSAEQKDMVSVISDSARTLLTIIDDILDLSKMEAGKMSIENIPMRLRQTVETTVNLVAPLGRGKGVEIAWRVDPALPDSYFGDPTRLRQILLNLLSNAVKFTDHGRVLAHVRGQADSILFEIEDTGTGMTEEQQLRLFQPFAQADVSTNRRFGGTGLGLVICKRLVDLMGGEITLSSALGHGSTFSFAIPLAAAPTTGDGTEPSLMDIRVLVADPLAESAGCLADALRSQGAEVVEAADGRAATAALAATRFDAVLVDQSLDPALFLGMAEPPAVLPLTAYGGGARGSFAEQWAATGLSALAKPLRWSAVAGAVAVAVGRTPVDTALTVPSWASASGIATSLPILVAEDNHTNRIVIAKQLDCLGLTYDMVEDGEAALVALAGKSYALLLADCLMPRLDGYGLTRRLRTTEEGSGRHLPVIALTANALADDSKRCLAAGMDDYLAKPVTLDKLDATLRHWLTPSDGGADMPAPHAVDQPPAEPAAEPIDCAALAGLIGDDSPETLALIFASFTKFCPKLLVRARAALDDRDRETLSDTVHAAKGAARSVCATRLAAILMDIETKAGGRTSFARLSHYLDAATTAYAEVEAFIAAFQGDS